MVLVSLERAQKAHTGHGFSSEGPLPGIMIQLGVGMMDLDRNLMGEMWFLPYVTGCASLSRRAAELRRKC